MGWSGDHKPKYISAIDYLKKGWDGHEKYEVIDSAMCGFKAIFFLMREKVQGYTFVVVYLTQYSNDYHNFHYKSMDEFAGPRVRCPKKFLGRLTPIEEIARLEGSEIEYPKEGEEYGGNGYFYAKRWREESEAYFKKSKDNAFREGDIFKTDEPLEFTSGNSFQYFKKINKKVFAVDPNRNFAPICIVRVNLKNQNVTRVTVK